MAIILLGFRNYDDCDHEYQVTGVELMKVCELLRHPIPPRTNAVGIVTIVHEGLTSESCIDKLDSDRGGDSQTAFALD